MRQILRIDANRHIGYGHAVRMAALVEELPSAETIVCGNVELFDHLFPGARLVDAPADSRECVELIASLAPNLVLCDSPKLGADFWRAARALSPIPLIAVDDYGGPVEADLIINGTVLTEYHCYPVLRDPAAALCGGEYALLRPCFLEQAWRDPDVRCLTVVAGSGVKAARWIRTLADGGLFAHHDGVTRLVIGWGFSDPDLAQQLRLSGVSVVVGLDGPQLAALLAQSTVLLATGGMIVYEALAVGVPSIVYPQEDNLVAEAAWFASHGGIIDLEANAGASAEHVVAAVAELWRDGQARQQLATKAASLIDGRGTQRAAAHIAHLMAEARP